MKLDPIKILLVMLVLIILSLSVSVIFEIKMAKKEKKLCMSNGFDRMVSSTKIDGQKYVQCEKTELNEDGTDFIKITKVFKKT